MKRRADGTPLDDATHPKKMTKRNSCGFEFSALAAAFVGELATLDKASRDSTTASEEFSAFLKFLTDPKTEVMSAVEVMRKAAPTHLFDVIKFTQGPDGELRVMVKRLHALFETLNTKGVRITDEPGILARWSDEEPAVKLRDIDCGEEFKSSLGGARRLSTLTEAFLELGF